jgi:predicted RNase H-like nuclease
MVAKLAGFILLLLVKNTNFEL